MMLVDEGKLKLSDEINQHLDSELQFDSPISVRHLLTHSSGLDDVVVAQLTPADVKFYPLVELLIKVKVNMRIVLFLLGVNSNNFVFFALSVDRTTTTKSRRSSGRPAKSWHTRTTATRC
jgi:hypothetical protein